MQKPFTHNKGHIHIKIDCINIKYIPLLGSIGSGRIKFLIIVKFQRKNLYLSFKF